MDATSSPVGHKPDIYQTSGKCGEPRLLESKRKVVQGYYQYHAVPGDTGQLRVFRRRICRLWRSVLIRRSQRAQVGWDRLNPMLNRWIPQPRVLHPYPDKRFDAIHRRYEPYA